MTNRRFSFVLPTDWFSIPLVREPARLASIERLLDRQFASKDEQSKLRQELRVALREQTKQSADVGGLLMSFYLTRLGEHPIAATMTCYDITALAQLPDFLDPRKLLASFVGDKELDASLAPLGSNLLPKGFTPTTAQSETSQPSTVDAAAGTAATDEPLWEKVTDFDVLAYRQTSTSPGTDYFGEDAPRIPMLQFNYTQVVPDFGLVNTAFATPVLQAAHAWQGMFDAIVATFRNGAPDAAPALSNPTSEE